MEKLYEAFAKTIAGVALAIVIVTFGSFIFAFPLKWAWNASVSGIFSLDEIGYWQAFALFWVSALLIKAPPKKADS